MSKTISVETTINAPLNKVWDEVSQINNHSNWMKDAVKIDFESELRSGIGTKIKVLTKIGPFFIRVQSCKNVFFSNFWSKMPKKLLFSTLNPYKMGKNSNKPKTLFKVV